ncbi:hypothetical protein RMCBS344292_04218 [Rhizopus microsporus]|nr:hypothetical protein RMCBS344292_04218 [Rhizopus microsporus]
MGNQVSSKKRSNEKSSRSLVSLTESSNNISTSSSCQPKFPTEYAYPHNKEEANRQQSQHYLLKHLFQGSYFAPVEEALSNPGSKVLDVGCGAHATWILDMAIDFPNCQFYGFDIAELIHLSEVELIHMPANCHIEKADLFDGFNYESNTFDYVHQRMMYIVYPSDKIPWMFQEILRVTKPNGWVELIEPDVIPKRAGPLFSKFIKALQQFLRDRLGHVLQGRNLVNLMIEAGFREVKSDYGSLPLCWGGYIGKLFYEDMLVVFQHLGPSIYEYMGLDGEYNKDSYEALLDTAFDECVEYQTFFNVRWAYGKKVVSSAA